MRAVAPAPTPTASQLDAQALPVAVARFDVVSANHMLYHVADLPRTLAEIRRVLVSDGCLYAATNGARHMDELDRLLGGDGVSTALPFRLENGAALLGAVFSVVTLAPYDGALVVTAAAPLLAYARSMYTAPGRDFAALEREVARRIATDGAIARVKAIGFFRAE